MELVVTVHDDGTFGVAVDGIPYTEADDAQTLFVRDSLETLLADVQTIFGGNADTIVTPDPPPPPPPSPVDSAGNINVEVFDPSAPTSDATPGSPAPPEPPTEPTPPPADVPVVEPNPIPPAVSDSPPAQ